MKQDLIFYIDRDLFINDIKSLSFTEEDIQLAKRLGYKDVVHLCTAHSALYAELFIYYKNDKALIIGLIDRFNRFYLFSTTDLNKTNILKGLKSIKKFINFKLKYLPCLELTHLPSCKKCTKIIKILGFIKKYISRDLNLQVFIKTKRKTIFANFIQYKIPTKSYRKKHRLV